MKEREGFRCVMMEYGVVFVTRDGIIMMQL